MTAFFDKGSLNEKVIAFINILFIAYAFFFPISSDISRQLLYVMALTWLLQGDYRQKIKLIFSSKTIVLYFCYIIILLGSLFLSKSTEHGFWPEKYQHGQSYMLSVHIQYFLIAVFIYTTAHLRTLYYCIFAYLLSILFCEFVSFGLLFDLVDTRMGSSEQPTPYMHYIFYSLYLCVALFLTLSLILSEQIKPSRFQTIGLWVFSFSLIINMLIISSRLGYLALIVGMLSFFFLNRRQFKKQFIKIISIGVGIIVLSLLLSSNLQQRLATSVDAINKLLYENQDSTSWETALGTRAALNYGSISYLSEEPSGWLLGLGMGDAKDTLNTYVEERFPPMYPTFHWRAHVHNQYLQLIIDGGMFALITVLLLFYSVSKLKSNPLGHFSTLMIIIYLTYSIGEIPLQRAQPLALFALIVGILLAFERLKHTPKHSSNSGVNSPDSSNV